MPSLTRVTTEIIDLAVQGIVPNVDFDKELYKDYIFNSTCRAPTAMEEFHLAMGGKKETADEALLWWSYGVTISKQSIANALRVPYANP